jgi:hypothetical protein
MSSRRPRALRPWPLALLTALWLAGCGASGATRKPSVRDLPLVHGAQVIAKVNLCDKGANAFCALDVVIVDRQYRSAEQLFTDEHLRLKARGWTITGGDTGDERAADSPGHKLRLTYSTASGDLQGIDLGWIARPRPITLTLSHLLFAGTPALSMMLEAGTE